MQRIKPPQESVPPPSLMQPSLLPLALFPFFIYKRNVRKYTSGQKLHPFNTRSVTAFSRACVPESLLNCLGTPLTLPHFVIPGRRGEDNMDLLRLQEPCRGGGVCSCMWREEVSSELAQDLWTKNNSCRVVQPSGLPARGPANPPARLLFLHWN